MAIQTYTLRSVPYTYKELAALYNEMMEWIKNNGYKPSGTSIEYYYSNPNVPEEEQVTRIEMPLL